MERWNWFLSFNHAGKWIITNGYAEIYGSEPKIQAILQFAPDADPYQKVELLIEETGEVEAFIQPLSSGAGGAYKMYGNMNKGILSKQELISVILSDGHSVLGFAKGSHTDEGNLA